MRIAALDEKCPAMVTDEEVEAAIEASKNYMALTHPGLHMLSVDELRLVWQRGLEAAALVRAIA